MSSFSIAHVDSSDEDCKPLVEFVKVEKDETACEASTSQEALNTRKRKLQVDDDYDFDDDDDDYAGTYENSVPSAWNMEQEMNTNTEYYVLHVKCGNEMKLIPIEKDAFNRMNILTKIQKAFSCSIDFGTVKTNLGATFPAEIFITVVKQFMNSGSFYLEVEKDTNLNRPRIDRTEHESIISVEEEEEQEEQEEVELYNLLKDWKVPHLYATLKAQKITMNVLQIMSSKHMNLIFRNTPAGDRIIFENYWEQYQNSGGIRKVLPQNNSTPPPSVQAPNEAFVGTYSLDKILQSTTSGDLIIRYYEANKCLNEEQRVLLINTIAKYIEINGCQLSLNQSNDIEQQILRKFPTEKLEYYNSGKRGRLYNKISNTKRLLRFLKVDSNSETTGTKTKNGTESENDEVIDNELVMLRSDKTSPEDFIKLWKKTFNQRIRENLSAVCTEDIFRKWPEYVGPKGARLIDLDFCLKYPHVNPFPQTWTENMNKIVKFMKLRLVNNTQLEKLRHLEGLNENTRDLVLLLGLHNLFPPTSRLAINTAGAKTLKRYSILDSQNSFVIVRNTLKEIDETMDIKRMCNRKIPPCIFVVGNERDVKEIYFSLDSVKYPIQTMTKAVDICFKAFFVLNLDFPQESRLFYLFLQLFFYNIPLKKSSIRVATTVSELRNFN